MSNASASATHHSSLINMTLPSCKAARERFAEGHPGGRDLAADEHSQHLHDAPRQVDTDHHAAPRRNHELHEPEREEEQRLVKAQLEIQQQQKSEEALQDRQENLVALE